MQKTLVGFAQNMARQTQNMAKRTVRVNLRQKFLINSALMAILILVIGITNGVILERIRAATTRMSSADVNRLIGFGITVDIVICLIAIAVSLAGSSLLARIVTGPILRMRTVANEITAGNLHVTAFDVTTRDELEDLATALKSMVESLRTLIQGIQSSSEQVAASAEELSASAEETMRATDEIAGSIQEVASGAESQMDEVQKTSLAIAAVSEEIRRVAVVSRQLSDDATSTADNASTGTKMMAAMDQQMETIQTRAATASERIANLSTQSSSIQSIVQTIKNIAGQTNLLALNAAIEAARAGEQGRGFAVVAAEVRKLASQSAGAAHEINQIMRAFAVVTKESVQSMEQVQVEVEHGNRLAASTRETFEQIKGSMDEVTDRIRALSTATGTISNRATDVSDSVNRVIQLAQTAAAESENVAASSEQQLAAMEEIASTAQALSGSAQELQGLIQRFTL